LRLAFAGLGVLDCLLGLLDLLLAFIVALALILASASAAAPRPGFAAPPTPVFPVAE